MRRTTWWKLGIALALAAGVVWGLHALGVDFQQLTPEQVREFIRSFGVWAPAIYLLAYGQPLVPLPASIMTGLGGALFGRGWGTLAALIGATLRAAMEFLVARLLGRDVVAKLLKGQVAALDQKLGQNSFRAVFLIRLIPNLPFDIQNYGFGFSQVRPAPYLAATFLGIMPGCFVFVYLGESLTDPKQIWKLGVAIALIIGLMLIQGWWKKRQRGITAPTEPP